MAHQNRKGKHGRMLKLLKHLTFDKCNGDRKLKLSKLLIANRGEIAIRIAKAAQQNDIRTVSIYTKDDELSLHTRVTDQKCLLSKTGVEGYLNTKEIIEIAKQNACDCIHPGYGFLSENEKFRKACEDAEIIFVGPGTKALRTFGDKVEARRLAEKLGIPVIQGSNIVENANAVEEKMQEANIDFPIMLKASAGGGGRGMRLVSNKEDLRSAFDSCASEARAAFGSGSLFFERYLSKARHVEVQILADAYGNVVHLFERDCSAQIRNQKIIEIAPAKGLSNNLKSNLYEAALKIARAANYVNAGTVEFLVEGESYYFIECNPRIQVEHTVTEQLVGIDLVDAQLCIAANMSIPELGYNQEQILPRGFSIQTRILIRNTGIITSYKEPSGAGIRVDSYVYSGFSPPMKYDPLIAKVVCSAPSFSGALQKTKISLRDFHLEGISTNISILLAILNLEDMQKGFLTTPTVERSINDKDLTSEVTSNVVSLLKRSKGDHNISQIKAKKAIQSPPHGHEYICSPMQGQIVDSMIKEGDVVYVGRTCIVLLSMKMEHQIDSTIQGKVSSVLVKHGQFVEEGDPIVLIELMNSVDTSNTLVEKEFNLDHVRGDLNDVLKRRQITKDEARLEHDGSFKKRLERRHKNGQLSARENIYALCDEGTFIEYGRFRIAAQRSRRALEDLILNTPADGIITGIGCVNRNLFGANASRTVVLAYDYTVLAGTQGFSSHQKTDRIIHICKRLKLPLVWFCEGGGGRPGDVDAQGGAGLAVATFANFGQLSGYVPLVGLVSGYCFAGNAALLGTCDVVIATSGCNIGMGGPAMIEGGGLGVFSPKEIGPSEIQFRNGVIDVLVENEREAVEVAKKYLSYFQGCLDFEENRHKCADQRRLRHVVPENRLRVYEMKEVIKCLVDEGSVLFLREGYGIGIITVLARIAGRPLGIIANNPKHLGGAIDSNSALKAARFIELCDCFDLPILSLIDCPGFMVGPESEAEASVRKMCKMFVVGGSLTVPYYSVIIRKSYGLGAQAMSMGTLMGNDTFCISWPTGELGGMGLEGAVRLGYSKELTRAKQSGGEEAQKKLYDKLLAAAYKNGKALNNAVHGEIDDVIDPAETRDYIIAGLEASPPPLKRSVKKRTHISTW